MAVRKSAATEPVAAQSAPLVWIKSSRSAENGCCVEVALQADRVSVRDTKDPDGAVLHFGLSAWTALLSDLKSGHLAPPT